MARGGSGQWPGGAVSRSPTRDRASGSGVDLHRVREPGPSLPCPIMLWKCWRMTQIEIASRLPELAALVGSEVGVSEWKRIEQSAIDHFAKLTGDDGPIHTDPVEAARIAPFGGTIVQGFMLLSHLTGFAKSIELPQRGVVFRLNYGFDRVRIITPVPVDAQIRGRFEIADLVARGADAALLTFNAKVELEGEDTPAVIANWLAYLQLESRAS